ncbi:hypothetical protein KDL01_25010, partial [Actinospica durhamensis]
MTESPLLSSLRRAVQGAPEDVPLRLHLAGLLVDAGLTEEAVGHLGTVLSGAPGSAEALELMRRALTGTTLTGTTTQSAADSAPAPVPA